jgi:hypothetical protein
MRSIRFRTARARGSRQPIRGCAAIEARAAVRFSRARIADTWRSKETRSEEAKKRRSEEAKKRRSEEAKKRTDRTSLDARGDVRR